jgi:hypothetical protein
VQEAPDRRGGRRDRRHAGRAQEFEENPDLVRGIINEGCERARETARRTMADVREAMGLEYS